ncbi:MAG: ribosome-binding factor A [Mariprofundaceae bacterium]
MHQGTATQRRFQADIHRLLGTLLQRDISDPRLQGIVITRVEAAHGRHLLKIWVHRSGEEDAEECTRRLSRLIPHFTHELRRALPCKRLPALKFCWDAAIDKGGDVLHLLQQLEHG